MAGHWLGNPTTFGMVNLPEADPGWQSPYDRGINSQQLLSGGTASVRRLRTRRSYDFAYTGASNDELAVLLNFYDGAYGVGPYAMLDPSVNNLLDLDDSLLGSRRGVLTNWAASGGALAYDSTVPAQIMPGGVARWTSPPNAGVFGQGSYSSGLIADTTSMTPYTAGEAFTFSAWLRYTSGTAANVTPGVVGYNSLGAQIVTLAGTAVTLTTTLTRYSVTIPAGQSGWGSVRFIGPRVVNNTASVSGILASNPQLSIGSQPLNWTPGQGTPRLVVDGPVGSTQVNAQYQDTELHLKPV